MVNAMEKIVKENPDATDAELMLMVRAAKAKVKRDKEALALLEKAQADLARVQVPKAIIALAEVKDDLKIKIVDGQFVIAQRTGPGKGTARITCLDTALAFPAKCKYIKDGWDKAKGRMKEAKGKEFDSPRFLYSFIMGHGSNATPENIGWQNFPAALDRLAVKWEYAKEEAEQDTATK